MCRILGRKLPGPEMKVLESGTRLGDEGSPGTDRLVTDSAECSNLTGVSSLSLFLCHHTHDLVKCVVTRLLKFRYGTSTKYCSRKR
jgi:hypothetical protein